MLGMAVNAFYGSKIRLARMGTKAKHPGIQAALEKSLTAMLGALAGARYLSFAGLLAHVDIFSPEQLMIDLEIRDWVARVMRGTRFDEEALSLDIIEQAAPADEFLTHPSTLANLRAELWVPSLLDQSPVQLFLSRGAKDVRETARAQAREALGRYQYELEPGKRRELERIYRTASEILL